MAQPTMSATLSSLKFMNRTQTPLQTSYNTTNSKEAWYTVLDNTNNKTNGSKVRIPTIEIVDYSDGKVGRKVYGGKEVEKQEEVEVSAKEMARMMPTNHKKNRGKRNRSASPLQIFDEKPEQPNADVQTKKAKINQSRKQEIKEAQGFVKPS